MDRRGFICAGAALALVPLLRQAWAAQPPAVDHAAMGHGGMGAAAETMPAAAALGLPAGLALPALPLLRNQSALPGVFSAALSAGAQALPLLPGKPATVFWSYNGQVPGPTIEVFEGDELRLHFENRLSQPTTIHWHGLPIPADQDGNPQDPVPPGGSREYRFTLPQGCAGSYWYHPHPHGHTAEQVYRGLAGVFVVKSRSDPLAHLPEQRLVLSDLKLDADGKIAANSEADRMDGREGQFLLVNGAWRPHLTLGVGERQRWRVWNASSARVLKLALPGHELELVGSDGGLLQRPRRIDSLTLPPGARAELVVTGRFEPGHGAGLLALPYRRGKMMSAEQDASLTLLELRRGAVAKATAPLPARLREIQPLGAPAVRRRVVLSEDMANPAAMFLINGKTFDMERADFLGKVGAVEEWEIVNEADMDHPFHIHGTQFQALARRKDGVWREEPFLAWRDVANVSAGETLRLRFRQDMPGLRMFHCHILEHEDAGMMGMLRVEA
ncbi:multicopper oxidase family protein [Chromobacterium sp. S0633]|uniref:multicopper oxidase family protein n=1 Tax=Chromobacterium sp. S0633 TaxID=2957805 RepID=UPI0020A0357F|nr:multicopper oxidase family protein [Chromobacterium sp. S0633]MCP1289422.1 multicopper oxidase family protein [Chromobacterium sp. S0633]